MKKLKLSQKQLDELNFIIHIAEYGRIQLAKSKSNKKKYEQTKQMVASSILDLKWKEDYSFGKMTQDSMLALSHYALGKITKSECEKIFISNQYK